MYACGSGAGLMIIFTAKKLGARVGVGTAFVVFLSTAFDPTSTPRYAQGQQR